jgi:hypothetical protein
MQFEYFASLKKTQRVEETLRRWWFSWREQTDRI